MSSAGEKVSDTYELLEMILVRSSTRDILLSQRVSKQWKEVIENSKKLQQALFMSPIEHSDGPFVLFTQRKPYQALIPGIYNRSLTPNFRKPHGILSK